LHLGKAFSLQFLRRSLLAATTCFQRDSAEALAFAVANLDEVPGRFSVEEFLQ
jgi:hypothetical protein